MGIVIPLLEVTDGIIRGIKMPFEQTTARQTVCGAQRLDYAAKRNQWIAIDEQEAHFFR